MTLLLEDNYLLGPAPSKGHFSLERIKLIAVIGGHMRFVLPIVFLVLLSGCSAKYQSTPLAKETVKLEKDKSVVIATPVDGRFNTTVYANSGKMTALAVQGAFARFAAGTTISDCDGLECLEKKLGDAGGYYVIPEILHWEDRATEWSGRPDRIEVRVAVFDSFGRPLSAVVFNGQSKWATLGGDHPQDLLAEPLRQYVETLY